MYIQISALVSLLLNCATPEIPRSQELEFGRSGIDLHWLHRLLLLVKLTWAELASSGAHRPLVGHSLPPLPSLFHIPCCWSFHLTPVLAGIGGYHLPGLVSSLSLLSPPTPAGIAGNPLLVVSFAYRLLLCFLLESSS